MPKRKRAQELSESDLTLHNVKKKQATVDLLNCDKPPSIEAASPQIFKNCFLVKGLVYIPNFLTIEEETNILNKLDAGEWSTVLKRRVQHFGYTYDYKKKNISEQDKIGALPSWSLPLFERLRDLKLSLNEDGSIYWQENPDQLIVNEYLPGQGITAHVDSPSIFGDPVVSISLGSETVMDISCGEIKHPLLLERRSLLLLSEEARYTWKHGIAARKKDKVAKKITESGTKDIYLLERGRRVSLTYRHMIMNKE